MLSKNIRKLTFIGFDVETYGDDNKFYSGGLYWIDRGQLRFEYFIDKEKMIKFMLARKFRNKYIVATNLDFDFTVLFYDTKYWNDIKMLTRDGKIIQATYDLKNNNGKIRFIDTANYAFFSVEKLGEIIGEKKLEKPKFLGKKPIGTKQKTELMIYNSVDCKITHNFMYFLQEGVNSVGGTVKLTIASTALCTWRMNFQPRDIIKESYITGDDSIKNFIFEGYYGGRTEVYKRGIFNNVNYYDVNSLYPFVMKNEYPLPNSVKKIPDFNVSIEYIKKYEGVTECSVVCPKMDKPLLPLRYNNKLTFPTGKFIGTWNNNELRKALELGYKIKPIKQIIYTETFRPFDSYVDTLYNLRLKYLAENNQFQFIVKLMLNSLYGKFGSKHNETYVILDMKTMNKSTEELEKLIGRNDFDVKGDKLIYKTVKEFNGLYSFPILSSYVTSYARLHMYNYINNKNVIYTDTDSIVTSDTLEGCSKILGAMKHEGNYNDCVFIRPKFYKIGETIKIKGLNKANKEDFGNILNGGSVSKMKFSKLRESAKKGIKPNTKMFVKKHMDLIDNKRVWEHNNLLEIANSEPLEVLL